MKKMILILIFISFIYIQGCYIADYSLAGVENGLGDKYYSSNRYLKSIIHYKNAYKFDKKGPFGERATYKLAEVMFKIGKTEAALKNLKKIIYSPTIYNYGESSKIFIAKIYFFREDFLQSEDYINTVNPKVLNKKEFTEYKKIKLKVKSKFDNSKDLRNLKKLYIELKAARKKFKNFIIAPGIKDFLPLADMFRLKELMKEKKEKFEKLKIQIKRNKKLDTAKNEYIKAYDDYKNLITKSDLYNLDDPVIHEAERKMREKFLKYQMILHGLDPKND